MKYFGIILIILLPLFSFTQVLEGTVFGDSDNGPEPLPGVNIFWQGTNRGVASLDDGTFKIRKEQKDHILIFSFVGYEQQAIHVHELVPLEITLEPNLELGEVEVVHKNRGTYLSKIDPMHTEHIHGAELHKAACCNLAESFETNPSVDVDYSDAVTGAKQIRLLGLEGTYSLLQLENMPNLRGLATNYGLTYIPGPWMESIQVSKGAASVLNGYESISGQINAEYKKPDSQEKLFLNTYAGTSGRLEFNGNGNIRVHKDMLTTGILLHASDLSKRNDDNGDGFLDEPLARQVQFMNRWKYNNHNGFMAQAGFSVLDESRFGGQVDFEKDMIPLVTNPYGINIETNRLEGFFKTGWVSENQMTALAWLSNFSHHETNSFYGINRYDAGESRFYGSAVLTKSFDEHSVHSLNTGFSFIYDSFDENLYNSEVSHTEKVPGLFAEYTYKPGHNFVLMAGLRSDFHNFFGTFLTPRMHFRYNPNEHLTLRASAGKGYRTANVLSENSYLLAASRPLQWEDEVIFEEAWNYGAALIQNYTLWERELQINAEYFRTNFISQLVIDRETSADHIILSALEGKSFANSIQVDLRYEPLERLDLLLAYRYNDVRQTIGGELREKPLTSRYKGLITLNYTTNEKKWMFDYTVQFNGGGRIPRYPIENIEAVNLAPNYFEFSPFTLMNAQVTKYFKHWNVYAGVENLADFRQENPVEDPDDPFGENFDATNVWGPVMGRRIYLGLRFNLNYK